MNFKQLRVAVVHDWCYTYGGAERVLECILDLFPQAEVYTLFDRVPDNQRAFLRGKTPHTTFLNRVPGIEHRYKKLLPLLPLAIQSFNLRHYDLIISSHYCVAKSVITQPEQLHICYCHSPMRYAWDMMHASLDQMGLVSGLKRRIYELLLSRLRVWDASSANQVDVFVANSSFIQKRIWRCYRRESVLIHPPVDTSQFSFESQKKAFFFTAGRLVPYKQNRLIVEAFRQMPHLELHIAGGGEELDMLKKIAPDNVKILGRLPADELSEKMKFARAFVFAAYEDFGIVPVEALACGTPLVAYAKGGAVDYVHCHGKADKANAVGFDEQSVTAIVAALNRFEQLPASAIDKHYCRQTAEQFSKEHFLQAFQQLVETEWHKRHPH